MAWLTSSLWFLVLRFHLDQLEKTCNREKHTNMLKTKHLWHVQYVKYSQARAHTSPCSKRICGMCLGTTSGSCLVSRCCYIRNAAPGDEAHLLEDVPWQTEAGSESCLANVCVRDCVCVCARVKNVCFRKTESELDWKRGSGGDESILCNSYYGSLGLAVSVKKLQCFCCQSSHLIP